MTLPAFDIGKYKLRPKTLQRMSMEFLCSIPVEPGTAALDDLEFDLKVSSSVLGQVLDWLWKNHKIHIRRKRLAKQGLMFYVNRGPMWHKAETLALDYWEKTYGKEEDNQKGTESNGTERENIQEEGTESTPFDNAPIG